MSISQFNLLSSGKYTISWRWIDENIFGGSAPALSKICIPVLTMVWSSSGLLICCSLPEIFQPNYEISFFSPTVLLEWSTSNACRTSKFVQTRFVGWNNSGCETSETMKQSLSDRSNSGSVVDIFLSNLEKNFQVKSFKFIQKTVGCVREKEKHK